MCQNLKDSFFNKEFFEFVTEKTVLAVMSSEVGEMQVETLLTRLTSWSASTLAEHMSARLLCWGKYDHTD